MMPAAAERPSPRPAPFIDANGLKSWASMAGAMPGYPPPGYPPGYPPPGYPPPQGYPQQQQQQQPGPPPAPAEDNSLESKLRKLKAALDAGLLTEDEYKAKRTKLLDAF